MKNVVASLFCVSLLFPATGSANIAIQFEEVGSFFADNSGSPTTPRLCLNEAASFFSGIITDDLAAIVPSGSNSWTATYTNPVTGASASTTDLMVPADTLVVYVGGANLPAGVLGSAGPGGFSYDGVSAAFANSILTRGESGFTFTDMSAMPPEIANEFAPWGGSVQMSTAIDWDFGNAATGGLCADTTDNSKDHFYSTLIHELAHVFGMGTAHSWDAQIVQRGDGVYEFNGTHAKSAYAAVYPTGNGPGAAASPTGNVPLSEAPNGNTHVEGTGHWYVGTESMLIGSTTLQEAALDPNITQGESKEFTQLDVAGLRDIGWNVTAVPEPSPTTLLPLMALLCGGVRFFQRPWRV